MSIASLRTLPSSMRKKLKNAPLTYGKKKEKGVAEITINIDTEKDYNDYCRIDCSTYFFYKDDRFYIPENVRERFRKIVKENVMWNIEERFGDLKGAINKFNREAKWIGYTKFIFYMMALSGWAVAAVLFLMR